MTGKDLQRARKTAAHKVEDRIAKQAARIAELEAALRVIARELPHLGDGADVGAMEIAVKVLDVKG